LTTSPPENIPEILVAPEEALIQPSSFSSSNPEKSGIWLMAGIVEVKRSA